jgi:hypothetical protein
VNVTPWTLLLREQDQDEAAAKQWWGESTDGDKLAVWDAIQALPCDTPLQELVLRFAQLGMTHIALMAEGKEGQG